MSVTLEDLDRLPVGSRIQENVSLRLETGEPGFSEYTKTEAGDWLVTSSDHPLFLMVELGAISPAPVRAEDIVSGAGKARMNELTLTIVHDASSDGPLEEVAA